MRLISLFSGAGISDVGFHQAGLECLAQVEIDKPASSVRRRHFPDTEHHEDIHDFNAIRYRGACDVVAGGFPCQDHSVAGRRGGLSGDRGALWWQMLRVIDEAQPDYVWGENVPGLLSSDGGDAFRSIVNSLVQLGYSVAWRVLDLRYFGVPQRRRRVLIVGSRVAGPSRGRAGSRLFEPDCLPWFVNEDDNEPKQIPSVTGSVPRTNCETVCVKGAAIGRVPTSGPQFGETLVNECFTLTTNEVHAVTQNEQVRKLLPVEEERLMGLEDGYTEFGADGERISNSARYKMLGNGWSVPQARWLAERFTK